MLRIEISWKQYIVQDTLIISTKRAITTKMMGSLTSICFTYISSLKSNNVDMILAPGNDLRLCNLPCNIRMVLPGFPALLNSIIIPLTVTTLFYNATEYKATMHANTKRLPNDILARIDYPIISRLMTLCWTLKSYRISYSSSGRR